MTPRNHLVLADGLHWHVVEMGEGSTVLLVHGTAASVHSWREVMPLLANTHHVIALDLPGHGGTKARSSSDYTLERMGRGITALCTTLKVQPDIVVGHSAGAAILAWMCGHEKIAPQKYISFNGAFYPYGGAAASFFSPFAKMMAFNPLLPRLLSGLASRHTVEKLLRDTGSDISAENIDHYFTLFKTPSHVAAALGMMAAWDLSSMDNCLARIKSECTFIAGGRDKTIAPEESARAAKRSRQAKVINIADCGHLLHEENPQLAAKLIGGSET